MSEKGNRTISLIAAFVAGAVVAAIIAFALTRQQSSTAQQAGPAEQGTDIPEESPAAGGDIDYALVFPSWDPDSTSLKELVDFVKESTDESGSEKKAADYMLEVEKNGWTPFSMADDWVTIYGEGVERTELPGTEEAQPETEEALPDAA